MKRILVTGAAGFIGFHLSQELAKFGYFVVGVDNVNDYYDPGLKRARLEVLADQENFVFKECDLADRQLVSDLFAGQSQFDCVVHLAAQAGVRYSIEHPEKYIDSNLCGFGNILEGCRRNDVAHLVFASSSSVYGANTKMPFCETDNVDHPVSLYAATKKANELMAHSYAHLYDLPCTGLRFFTVYGPWGRPDMAYFKFAKSIVEGRTIQVYNHGKMQRDFTYIDDVVEGIMALIEKAPEGVPDWSGDNPDPSSSRAPYRIYNIGNSHPEPLEDLIELLESEFGRKAVCEYLPMQPGDVVATFADTSALEATTGFTPRTSLADGVRRFADWYKKYYQV